MIGYIPLAVLGNDFEAGGRGVVVFIIYYTLYIGQIVVKCERALSLLPFVVN